MMLDASIGLQYKLESQRSVCNELKEWTCKQGTGKQANKEQKLPSSMPSNIGFQDKGIPISTDLD